MYGDLGLPFFVFFAVLTGLSIKPVYSWSGYDASLEPASTCQPFL